MGDGDFGIGAHGGNCVTCERDGGSNNRDIPQFVSHVSDDGRYESVRQHLLEVADMAKEFADAFGAGEWAYYAGLYHDIGKYSKEFQRRILHNGRRCDHSTAGARELADANLLLSYVVAGHHGGLPDGGRVVDNVDNPSLTGRLLRKPGVQLPVYEAFKEEMPGDVPATLGAVPNGITPVRMTQEDCEYLLTFLTRMVYSCIVDADFLCTERFMRGEGRAPASSVSLDELANMLEERLARFYPPKTPINELRCQVLDDCLAGARLPKGFFSLTVPTGGGKTFASLRFAFAHAREHGMSRVIYGIPYTSIIEQNAQVFREVFGNENVLEHHGALEFDDEDGGAGDRASLTARLRLATENWDAPLIVTTNVQLFESLYAAKPSRCRKLHNLANSVIVLDEAQMLPSAQLLPCLRALVELVHNYGCTVVFCTATQPSLDGFVGEYGYEVTELARNVPQLFEVLRRVTYEDLGIVSDETLAERLAREPQVLCVVNSRAQAKNLYELLAQECDDGSVLHLSTLMTAEHRTNVIKEIRRRLSQDEPCRVVSTSLVEAGVDLDFPTVYRAKAGLDSLIQAAGRCNRNGNRTWEESRVFLFDPEESYRLPTDIDHKKAVSRDFTGDPLMLDMPENVRGYFRRLYSERDLDRDAVLKELSDPKYDLDGIPFKKMGKRFHMIDEGSYSVVIPDGSTEGIIRQVRDGEATRGLLRKLARHTVSLYKSHLMALWEGGIVEPLLKGSDMFVLIDAEAYDHVTGLTMKAQEGRGVFFG